MPAQKFKVTIEIIESRYFTKIFELDSSEFYDPNNLIPNNMYDEISDLLDEIFIEDFEYMSDCWECNQAAVGPNDGVFIETVELI